MSRGAGVRVVSLAFLFLVGSLANGLAGETSPLASLAPNVSNSNNSKPLRLTPANQIASHFCGGGSGGNFSCDDNSNCCMGTGGQTGWCCPVNTKCNGNTHGCDPIGRPSNPAGVVR